MVSCMARCMASCTARCLASCMASCMAICMTSCMAICMVKAMRKQNLRSMAKSGTAQETPVISMLKAVCGCWGDALPALRMNTAYFIRLQWKRRCPRINPFGVARLYLIEASEFWRWNSGKPMMFYLKRSKNYVNMRPQRKSKLSWRFLIMILIKI